MFARPLETGTFRFAWTQGVGRRRLVATTLMVFVLELTVLSFPLGIVLSRLWFDLSPQFPGLWTNHVFFTDPWMMAFSSVIGLLAGVLLGVVFRRLLAALAATTAMMIAIYLWATMWPFFQETLLWFVKRMPSSYAGVPLENGNYLAHYDYSSVNFYFTDRSPDLPEASTSPETSSQSKCRPRTTSARSARMARLTLSPTVPWISHDVDRVRDRHSHRAGGGDLRPHRRQ